MIATTAATGALSFWVLIMKRQLNSNCPQGHLNFE
jgi:hypothetical protein